jgi:hypothetical protein
MSNTLWMVWHVKTVTFGFIDPSASTYYLIKWTGKHI